MQYQPLRAWKLGLTTSQRVPSPNYDMDAYMVTLFGDEAQSLCCQMVREKKIVPTLNKSHEYFFIKLSRSEFIDN